MVSTLRVNFVFLPAVCLLFLSLFSCNKTETAVSNIPNCYDGIRNNNERGIDCGGPDCLPCAPKMTALVNGTGWNLAGGYISTQVNTQGTSLFFSGSDSIFRTISLIHSGPFLAGQYNLAGGLFIEPSPSTTYTAVNGTIVFSEWDLESKTVKGNFSFDAVSASGDTANIRDGYFELGPY